MLELPQRLEFGNPNHIKAVIQYELQHGYDRRTNKNFNPIKEYEVTVIAPLSAWAKAKVVVEASDEDGATKAALAKVRIEDFEFDDISIEPDYDAREVEEIEEIKEA